MKLSGEMKKVPVVSELTQPFTIQIVYFKRRKWEKFTKKFRRKYSTNGKGQNRVNKREVERQQLTQKKVKWNKEERIGGTRDIQENGWYG